MAKPKLVRFKNGMYGIREARRDLMFIFLVAEYRYFNISRGYWGQWDSSDWNAVPAEYLAYYPEGAWNPYNRYLKEKEEKFSPKDRGKVVKGQSLLDTIKDYYTAWRMK